MKFRTMTLRVIKSKLKGVSPWVTRNKTLDSPLASMGIQKDGSLRVINTSHALT